MRPCNKFQFDGNEGNILVIGLYCRPLSFLCDDILRFGVVTVGNFRNFPVLNLIAFLCVFFDFLINSGSFRNRCPHFETSKNEF